MHIHNHTRQRIAVIGGGANGLIAALALKTQLGEHVDVCVYETLRKNSLENQHRVVALAQTGLDFLKILNIWHSLEAHTQVIHRMCISDTALEEPLRSILLTFTQPAALTENDQKTIAAIIPNARLNEEARSKALAMGVVILNHTVSDITQDSAGGYVHMSDAKTNADMRYDLIVLADGSRSTLRERLGFGWVEKQYTQTALVGTLAHQHNHHGSAFQHFLPAGPFAILPLKPLADHPDGLPYRSSIVWSERSEVARAMVSRPDVLEAIQLRAGSELGQIALETPLQAFPLHCGLARSWVKNRVVLLGDSAHVFHPLAGQGLHLGLQDAQVLCECIKEAVALGLSVSDVNALQKYERIRRPAAVSMVLITDHINRLFSQKSLGLRLVRQLGMRLLEKLPAIKRSIMRIPQGQELR